MSKYPIYSRPVYVSDLDTWSFCNYAVKIDLELEKQGMKIETEERKKGIKWHEQIEKELGKVGTPIKLQSLDDVIKLSREGHFIYAMETPLKSTTIPLAGRIDYYFCVDGRFYILDFKTSVRPNSVSFRYRSRVWDSQGTALVGYGILIEENTNTVPILGVDYISDEELQNIVHKVKEREFKVNDFKTLYERSEKIPYTEELKAYVISQVKMIADFKEGKKEPIRSHNLPGKCRGCNRRAYCPIKLV